MLLALAFALITAPILARAAEPDPSGVLGYWLSDLKKLVVEIYPCEEKLCGKIVWYADVPLNYQGHRVPKERRIQAR